MNTSPHPARLEEAPVRSVHVPRRLVEHAWGGTETTVVETARAFRAAGHPATVLTSLALSDQARSEIRGVPVRRFPYSYPFLGLSGADKANLDLKGGNLMSFSLLRALLQEPDVDVFHAHSAKRLGAMVRTAARVRSVPYVITVHGNIFDVPEAEKASLVEPVRGKFEWGRALGMLLGSRRVLDDADAIVCVGESEYKRVQQALPGQRVELVPNGVDANHFGKGDGPSFRRDLSISPTANVLLCVSRIDPQKNQLALVRMLPELKARHPETHLVLIGPVTCEQYRQQLDRAIRERNLDNSVHVIPGFAPGDPKLVDAYHAADVFCLPSRHEPFGIVILEAWAAGLPVVAARVGGIPGFVNDGTDTVLVQPGDEPDLLQAVDQLLVSPFLSKRLAHNGRRRAQQEFDWARIADRLLGLYRELQRQET